MKPLRAGDGFCQVLGAGWPAGSRPVARMRLRRAGLQAALARVGWGHASARTQRASRGYHGESHDRHRDRRAALGDRPAVVPAALKTGPSGYAARVRGPLFLFFLLVGPLVLSRSARADVPNTFFGRWYGWQVALADAAAVGLTLAPVDSRWRGATVTVGLTGLFINGPVVNMMHGHSAAASRSLLRLPAFLLGRLFGFGAGQLFCQESGCKAPLLTAGSAFGLGTVMILDLLDAFEPAPWWLPDPEPPPPPHPDPRPRPWARPPRCSRFRWQRGALPSAAAAGRWSRARPAVRRGEIGRAQLGTLARM